MSISRKSKNYNLDIAMCIPGLPFNGESLDKQSLGGSESAAAYMARELVAVGHSVNIFTNTDKPGMTDGVIYHNSESWASYSTLNPHDVSIIQRSPKSFCTRLASKLNLLWQHDLALLRQMDEFKSVLWNIDKVMTVSQYMTDQYKEVYGLEDDLFWTTRNGIDAKAFKNLPGSKKRNRKQLVCACRPERGWDVLLKDIMPKLLEKDPDYRLVLCGYDNPTPQMSEFYAKLHGLMAQFQGRVRWAGNLKKADLFRLYAISGLYVYPTPSPMAKQFSEVSPVSGETLIETLEGPKKIKSLVGKSDFKIYSCDYKGDLSTSTVKAVMKTRKNTRVLKLTFRPGVGRNAKKENSLILTPDHEVMLTTGRYISAGDIQVGDRVKAFTRRENGWGEGYDSIGLTGRECKPEHRFIMEKKLGRSLLKGETVDHLDGNTKNNSFGNLEVKTHSQHKSDHWDRLSTEELASAKASRTKDLMKFHKSLSPKEMKEVKRKACLEMWKKQRDKPTHKQWLQDRSDKRLEKVASNHIIMKIEEAEPEDVYCMEVDPDHNFIANGIVVHNCISMMEAMAAGLPFLSSDKGALSETSIEGASSLVEGDSWTEEYQNKFVDEIIAITTDDVRYTKMSKAGRQGSSNNDWRVVAEEWTEEMNRLIVERNDSPERLAMHFIKRSDIFAAEKAIENSNTAVADNIKASLQLGWGFRKSREEFKKHYLEMGKITDDRLKENTFTKEHFEHSDEKRFALIKEFLSSKPELKTIIDHGCGHGWHTIYMEKQVGRKWVGVDVDPRATQWCEKFKEYANEPDNLSFVSGDYLDVTDENNPSFIGKHLPDGKADCLIISEVLEHCIDPAAVVEKMEKQVKKGGYVLITVPYGPREYPDYDRIQHRNHIHELDIHTLKDIFGNKPHVDIIGIFETVITELEEPAGFYMLKYQVDHKPLGKIDWERKLALQRPMQTLGASLIGGEGCEDTLRWCLKSLQGVVSEIVVGDTGLSEEAKSIVHEYGGEIIKAPDPLVDGFDEARNATLSHLTSDWIFWMDTDEKLHGGNKIFKYLRENLYKGYSIRQHHFAVDTDFKPDLPVRLFRNITTPGKEIKFFNSIHEHPETGINEGPGPTIILSDTHISHLGYLHEEGRRVKFWRNRALLLKSLEKNPERLLNQHFVMRDNMLLCNYELQENGGRITDSVRKLSKETIDIFQEHFLGKGFYLNVDSLEYYSQACSHLGVGVDITYCVQAHDSDKKPEMKSYRFASLEDFKKEMDRLVCENVEPRMSKWW